MAQSLISCKGTASNSKAINKAAINSNITLRHRSNTTRRRHSMALPSKAHTNNRQVVLHTNSMVNSQ
jgi:hypothetical protein